jgi:hypothetical protein
MGGLTMEPGSCDVARLFPNAEETIKGNPIGYILEGLPGLPIKHMHWGVAPDPLKVSGCQMALVKFLDGSPVAVRYFKRDFHEFTSLQERNYSIYIYLKAHSK